MYSLCRNVSYGYVWVRNRKSYAHPNKVESKQGRQCTYNVTLRRVRAIIDAVEKQLVLRNIGVYL